MMRRLGNRGGPIIAHAGPSREGGLGASLAARGERESFRAFFLQQALFAALINAILNFTYTWWMWSARAVVGLFTGTSVGYDLAATPAAIAFLCTICGTHVARGYFRGHPGVVARLGSRPSWLRLVPHGVFSRSIVAMFAAGLVFGLPVLVIIALAVPLTITSMAACWTKAGLTVCFSLILIPFALRAALDDVWLERGHGWR